MFEILTRAACFISIILLGYGLRKIGFFKKEDFGVLSKIVINITLPAAIIKSFSGKEWDYSLLLLAFLALGSGILYMIVGYLIHKRKGEEAQIFGILNLPGYNIGNFTLPFVQSFLGATGVIVTSIFDTGNACICLGTTYGVASVIKENKGFSVKRIVKALGRSIPFKVYLIMIALSCLGIGLPTPVLSLVDIIADANAFLPMFMIGVGFELSANREQLGSIVRILSLRYGIAVLLAVVFYLFLPFSLEVRQTMMILVFAPIASTAPAYTQELDGDVGLSSAINSISIIISIICIVTILMVTM